LSALVRFVALPLAAALCFLLFLHLGFPYDRLAGPVAQRIGQATGMQVQIGELAPRLSLGGPGLDALGITATPPGGRPIRLERAFLRPAWSAAWLHGDPALHLDLTGVELASLPLAAALPGSSLEGQAQIGLDWVVSDESSQGRSRFDARDGSLGLPGLPMPLPFTRFQGELRYGGESLVEIEDATLTGPLVSLQLEGRLGRGASVETSPLQLDLEYSAQPELKAPLAAAGIQLAPDGKGKLQITGTPTRPEIR
jgi:hypothetical protein